MKFDIIYNKQTPAVPEIVNVKQFITDNKELMEKFLDYSKNLEYMTPVGLAANQISVDGERIMRRFISKKDRKTEKWEICIDPKIIWIDEIKSQRREGCLTWGPDKMVVAERYQKVAVQYYDIDGIIHEVKAEAFESQVWQHETNHLNGIEEDIHKRHGQLISTKIQNNTPCPCGSGKKYKKCCK